LSLLLKANKRDLIRFNLISVSF